MFHSYGPQKMYKLPDFFWLDNCKNGQDTDRYF